MRLGKVALVGLALVALASLLHAALRQPDELPNPAAGLAAHAAVPAHVMSTLRAACFDCHSNETRRPWYARLPVASWLIERDVNAGRGQLNFSKWGQYNAFDRADLLDKVCQLATAGTMPLPRYRMLHREARLTSGDIAQLCDWSRKEATRLVQGGS